MKMSSEIKYNDTAINGLEQQIRIALEKTAEATVSDLKNSQTIPFNIGTLNDNTKLDPSASTKNKVVITSNTKYARRLYHHPEYNFRTTNHANAGAYWFEPYVSGNKKNFIPTMFAIFMKKGGG